MVGSTRENPRRWLRRRSFILAVLALVTLLSGAVLPFLAFDGRIDVMLPDRSDLQGVFGFLREIQVADKILVTFSMRDGSADPDVLIAAADRYAAGLDSAVAVPLNAGFQASAVAADFDRLARQLPEYTSREDLERLAESISSPERLHAALQALKNRLQKPEGLLSTVSPSSDPLDWNGRLAGKILHVVASFGYRAVPVRNHLMDSERRHLLMVLQTPVLMTDTVGGRRLLDHLGARAADLPPSVEARLVCGHLHTAGNEAVIRRDIRNTALAISVVFLVLFLAVYRDGRAIGILLIPMLASVPALALAASVFRSFSYIVIGFGSVIAGIAVDYGIHAYVAARSDHPARNLAGIRRPVTLSALTTLCVFATFCFSGIPAYRQLGVFASTAILISLGYAFWALPPFSRARGAAGASEPAAATNRGRDLPVGRARKRAWLVVGLSAIGFLVGLALLSRLPLEPDVSKLDGTPKATLDEETRALAIWGGGQSLAAILVVAASDEKEALRLNDRAYEELRAAGFDVAAISSLSPLYPSDETRRVRRAAWNAFWTSARIAQFRKGLVAEAATLDFSEQAFSPFWDRFDDWRREPSAAGAEPVGFLEPLHRQFVHEQDGQVRITTFIPDEPRWIAAARALQREIPSLRVISRRAFSEDLSRAVVREMARISLLAAILIVLVTGLAIRRVGMLFLSLIPALAGMIWGGAGMALWGLSLNISNLIAGILVFGLCIDYGICMAYAVRRGMRRDMFRAVTLSALTTALGAAVLLIARHPAFISIGITLVFGVSAGYLCAWLLLPALQTLFPRLNPPENDNGSEGGA